jgi:glutamyl-Q tRNA(Asp) synthetase
VNLLVTKREWEPRPLVRARLSGLLVASIGTARVFRFAPSPNGEMHLGHALSALIGHEAARACGGRFLVRIEDIDRGRSREAFVAGIFRDLAWLGIAWEEPVLFQSRRLSAYREAAARLEAMGLLYPCLATRAEIEAAAAPDACDPDGAPLYPGVWKNRDAADISRRMSTGEPCALRLDMAAALAAAAARLQGAALTFSELTEVGTAQTLPAEPARWGDAVIVRKDVPASYHLAVVVDDAWQGVTDVTRGRDLFAATDLHRLLKVLLDLPAPRYSHHRLITDAGGRKLAKSARDTSLRALREQGCTPADIRRMVGLA